MPCYREELDDKHGNRAFAFICGKLGPHCRSCAAVSTLLCDFPVGNDKTCDAPMCVWHGTEVAPDIHYCGGHYAERTRAGAEI